MYLGVRRVVMVQYFPATGNYIVHFQGAGVEHFISDSEFQESGISEFIADCLQNHNYHESTIHMHTNRINGKDTVPLRQVLYCRSFASDDQPMAADKNLGINWVLWVPADKKLTVNTGVLSTSKDFIMESLEEAPEGVVEFMSACTDGNHVALTDHHCEPDYSGESVVMRDVDEYFFSTGKVIYGFQHNHVGPFTRDDAEKIGIEFYAN